MKSFKIKNLRKLFQALPPTVESRCEVKRLHAQLTGAHTDAEYGIDHVKVDI